MNADLPRFSILQLLELIAVLAVALALGRVVPPHVGPSLVPAPRLALVFLGSALGGFLGLRWFGRNKTVDRAMKTIPLSILVTAVMLLPIFVKLWAEATVDQLHVYPAWERWRSFGFLSLAAGIIGPLFVSTLAPLCSGFSVSSRFRVSAHNEPKL